MNIAFFNMGGEATSSINVIKSPKNLAVTLTFDLSVNFDKYSSGEEISGPEFFSIKIYVDCKLEIE